MKPEPDFSFSKQQLLEMRSAIKAYVFDELALDIGDLQADLLIDFISQQFGKQFYNLGVADTITAIKEKAEDLALLIKE